MARGENPSMANWPSMIRSKISGCCRLCGRESVLVDSHTIPRRLYKALKAGTGFYRVLSTDSKREEVNEQSCITEPLLCRRCDNERLGKCERHVAQLLGGIDSKIGIQAGRILKLDRFNYKRLKNGLLSILWRMSISSDPVFSEVDLGSRHEERLRLTLLEDAEFQEEEYAIMLTVPLLDGAHSQEWILPRPHVTRMAGNRVYSCLLAGLMFSFFVGLQHWTAGCSV